MSYLIQRNLRIFFRDRMAIFFSLLSVLITIGLYVFFLADTMLDGDLELLDSGKEILNLWLVAGLLSIASVTTVLGAYGIMVDDVANGRQKDFFVSSIRRWKLALSYMISAFLIAMIMIAFTMLIAQLFLAANGQSVLSLELVAKGSIISIANVICGAAMMFLLASFLKTTNAFTNCSVLVGTLVGFVTAVYLPIGILPDFAQTIVKLFPISHGCAMLRNLFVGDLLSTAIPDPAMAEGVETAMGVKFQIKDHMLTMNDHMIYLFGAILLFTALSLWAYRHKKQK